MGASVAIQNAEVRGQLIDRFFRESVRSFPVPEELACDRAFLADPADAAYRAFVGAQWVGLLSTLSFQTQC